MDLVTEAARALVGVQSDWVEATHPVEASELRRFMHAMMDPNARHRPGYTGPRHDMPVAPLGFPVHAYRRAAADDWDPIEGHGDPEFDGESRLMRPHLPRMPVKLRGVLNGGYDYEFFSHARLGERIFCRSAYRDVKQRQGRSGPMVIVTIDDEFAAGGERRKLFLCTTNLILR
ncbi:FAS1-like dehydratase domain-containing protein [Falsiroseomonas stagni]|uniref:N-terminal half of MaoC dehydratase n=1 Tax=Falsiroseomonas stagni DSM 19981 TaxID=1123062 RepID=A0A1I4AW73_9PROT|nr:MaoC family dehydratase N-terminal domain-containing protein [Falsiroseomonas stagni]SFK60842.1 N-terminal half of MaoC dehydratase [Falsiroseomonas stagni DSM 19981]